MKNFKITRLAQLSAIGFTTLFQSFDTFTINGEMSPPGHTSIEF